jgi:hypothetical protein
MSCSVYSGLKAVEWLSPRGVQIGMLRALSAVDRI